MTSRFTVSKRRSHSRFNSSSLASIASRLTLDRDTPTVSAISGNTARYCRVETPRNKISNIRLPSFPIYSTVPADVQISLPGGLGGTGGQGQLALWQGLRKGGRVPISG